MVCTFCLFSRRSLYSIITSGSELAVPLEGYRRSHNTEPGKLLEERAPSSLTFLLLDPISGIVILELETFCQQVYHVVTRGSVQVSYL
jgi:hypothetical protein